MSTNTPQHNKQKLEAMLRSEDMTVATDGLLYLCFNIDDPEWIQIKCIDVIENHRNDDVRGLAMTCIGHVARMHKVIDKSLVIPVLFEKLKHSTLSGRAQDALDDIDVFINRPTYLGLKGDDSLN
ncbi:hypothetical protein [Pseudomonas sp. Ps21-P2]|jgi:hypothetical protein|uniref:hypothetical protein n=1 Tax=Pseudomonas sp. Ps21-P2 TaxID=3080331 RepID=UPI0032096DBD